MAVIKLNPNVISNVEGPFHAIWTLLDEQSELLNFGTNGQDKPILPGEELIESGTNNKELINNAWEFKADETLLIRHDKPIKYVASFCEIIDKIGGDIDYLYFIKKWRWSIDNKTWSSWADFKTMPENWNWLDDLYVEIKYIALERLDAPQDTITPEDGYSLFLYYVDLNGEIEINRTTERVTLTDPDQCMILSPYDKWKVFKLYDYNLIAGGITENRYLDIRFRVTHTHNRLWSEWMPLNKDNLKSLKIDPLRFWYIEVQFCRKGDDPSGEIKIWDLEIIGDLQNVTQNYKKMGKMGFRNDCQYDDTAGTCEITTQVYPPPEFEQYEKCDDRFTKNKWNPYDLKATDLYNKITNDINKMFGWEVVYYKTDPDQRGRDVVLHEYSISHVIEEKRIKILVDNNKFPKNEISFTPFDLDLFETFVVHITRDEFKNAFGLEERPRKWDMLFLCETNRLYQVDHAQAHKDFLNTSVYYEVLLSKAQNNLHVKPTVDIQQSIDELTENNSLDALFKEEVEQETKNISNKPQLQALTHDVTRKEINSFTRIINEPIFNGPNIISNNYYDFSNVSPDSIAIIYDITDNVLYKGENRSFIFWINLKSKKSDLVYNIITNQVITDNVANGYKISYSNNIIDVEWGNQLIEIPISELQINHWYAFVLQMNQVQQKWEYFIYRRQSDINPRSYMNPELVLVKADNGKLTPIEYNIQTNIVIFGSELKMTNIRIFKELIEFNNLQMVLSQSIIRESGKLILADNVNKQDKLPITNYREKEARNI